MRTKQKTFDRKNENNKQKASIAQMTVTRSQALNSFEFG